MKKIILLLFGIVISLQAADLSGREVIKKMISSSQTKTMQMTVKLTHTDMKRGKEKTKIREMLRFTKRYDDGKYSSKSLLRFVKPDIVKGTGFLIWANRSGGNDQWLFLPKLKTAKQIESKEKTQRFMNTEFSYEDLESYNQTDEQYFHKGEEKIDELNCHIVEVIGHTQTQYKKRLVWIDSEKWLMRKVEFYDKNNKLIKILYVEEFHSINNNKIATKLIMKNVQTGSQTVMDISEIKYGISLTDQFFTKESLVNPK